MKNLYFVLFLVPFLLSGQGILREDLYSNSDYPQPLSPSNNEYLERIGEWPYGPSLSVAVDSFRDIIFLGSGGAVLILDGSNKTNPQLITDTIRTIGLVQDIFYDSSTERLYLACGEGGYEIWNVEDPSNPFLYSRNEIYYFDVETPIGHVQVRGDFAVFECSWGYINSVNVSDPYNPYQVSLNGSVGNPAHNIHIDQLGYIHATGQQNYVVLYMDGSGQLYIVGQLPINNCNAVFGGALFSYIGQGDYLYIIDLSNPSPPQSVTDVGGITHIEVRGNLAYIINDDGLHIWDVSNSNNPYLIASLNMAYPYDLYLAGNYAYVSVGASGLNIMDISDPSAPMLVGSFDTYSVAIDARVKDNIAYVAHSDDGLLMIDISNLEYPELIGQYETSSYNYDVELKDNLAFLTCWEAGFRIVNVSNPASPVEISSIANFNAWKLEISENYAYVVETYPPNTSYNLKVINITDPYIPVEVSSIQFTSYVTELAYYNGYLFIANYEGGLRILNVTNPQNPNEVNNLPLEPARDVYIFNNFMYVSSGGSNGGLLIYDLTNPAVPVEVGYFGGSFFNTAVVDSFVYANDHADDIWLFYAGNSNPFYIDQYRFPDNISDILAAGKYLYISNSGAGFSIYKNKLIENPLPLNWVFQTSGITSNIWDIDMLNLAKGFATAEDGIMLRTDNGGTHWETLQISSSVDDFRCLDFGDNLNGWAGTESGKVFNTIDGGGTWNEKAIPSSGVVRDIDFLNASTGWIITLEDHYLLKTSNGGQTWVNQNSGLPEPYRYFDLHFLDENIGFVSGALTPSFPWNNFITKTTNGGNSWSTIFQTQAFIISDIYFIDYNVGFLGGLSGDLYKTSDGGGNWQYINTFSDISITDFCFVNNQDGWFIGSDGALFRTTDAGNTWTEQEIMISNYLRAIDFVDEENGWIVGNDGIILRKGDGIVPVELTSCPLPTEFSLSQNYPNPFNPVTKIEFSIPKSDIVHIKVYDVLGKEIKALLNEYKTTGTYEVEFNANNLPSGIYFYRMISGSYSETKKMILLR